MKLRKNGAGEPEEQVEAFRPKNEQNAGGAFRPENGYEPGNVFGEGQAYAPGNEYPGGETYQPGNGYPGGEAYAPGEGYSGEAYQPGNGYPGGEVYAPGNGYPGDAVYTPGSLYPEDSYVPGNGGAGGDSGGWDGGGTMDFSEKDPPKRRRWLPWTIGGAGIVLVLVLGFLFLPKLFASPKTQVWTAFTKLGAEWNFPVAEEIGWDSISAAASSKQNMELELFIDELPASIGSSADMLKSFGILLSANLDRDEKQMEWNLGYSMGGSDLLSLNFYGDEELLAISVPELFDGAAGIGTGNLKEQIENSPMFDEMGMSERELEELDFSLNLWGQPGSEGAKELTKRLTESLVQWEDAIRVEEMDRTEEIKIGGKKQTCQGYLVVIPKDAAMDFLIEFKDVYREALENQMELLGGMESFATSYGNSWEYMEEEFDDFLEEFDEYMADEWEAEIYLTKSGDLAEIVVEDLSEWMEDGGEEIRLEVTFTGEERPSDTISLAMTDSDGEGIFLEKTSDITKKETSSHWELWEEFYGDKEPVFTLDCSYDADLQGFSYWLTLEEEEVSIFLEGGLGEVQKGKSVEFEIDSVGVEAEGERMTLSGRLKYGKLEDSIEKPSDVNMILEMDEDEIEDFVMEIQQGILDLQNSFLS